MHHATTPLMYVNENIGEKIMKKSEWNGITIILHQNDLMTGIDTPEILHMESLVQYGVKVTRTFPDGTKSVYGISDDQAENIIARFATEENTRSDKTGIYIDVDADDFEEPVE